MKLRHELKHEITACDMLILRQRLAAVAQPDAHAVNGVYQIRSLYFDTPSDTALREKISGISRRAKYRMRYYNNDLSFIHLEQKCKIDGLGYKRSALLSIPQAQALSGGVYHWLDYSGDPLLQEFYYTARTRLLQAKTIVEYTREAYTYPVGNVRVTMDYHIRTGLHCTDFLNARCPMTPAGDEVIILEVKWDECLPDIIRQAVQLKGCRANAFSKYAACRIYD